MDKIKFKKTLMDVDDAYKRVLYWFFAYPTRQVSLNDLTKQVNISKTTANKVVSQLKQEGFLNVEILGKVWRISCNQRHIFNTIRKIPYNLELVYESGIIEEILKVVPHPRSIILFGSYRKGDDIEISDIDLAVETLDNREVKIVPFGTIPQLGYRERVKVNILKFSRNKIDVNLFANLVNGIVLYGFFEAKP